MERGSLCGSLVLAVSRAYAIARAFLDFLAAIECPNRETNGRQALQACAQKERAATLRGL